jgi:hypothetical protein
VEGLGVGLVPEGSGIAVGLAHVGVGAELAVELMMSVGDGVSVASEVGEPLSVAIGVGVGGLPAQAVGVGEEGPVVGLGEPAWTVAVVLGLGCGVPDGPPAGAGTWADVGAEDDTARATETVVGPGPGE